MATLVILTVRDIQTWLEASKLEVTSTDPDDLDVLEATHRNMVYGRLAQRFTVGSWLNAASTPSMVKQIVAMLVAASVYRRFYSEDLASTKNSWADWLEEKAKCTIDELLSGQLTFLDESGVVSTQISLSQPAFYPDDTNSAADGAPYFAMGKVF